VWEIGAAGNGINVPQWSENEASKTENPEREMPERENPRESQLLIFSSRFSPPTFSTSLCSLLYVYCLLIERLPRLSQQTKKEHKHHKPKPTERGVSPTYMPPCSFSSSPLIRLIIWLTLNLSRVHGNYLAFSDLF